MRDIIKMNILTKFHENIPFGTKVIIRKPKVDAPAQPPADNINLITRIFFQKILLKINTLQLCTHIHTRLIHTLLKIKQMNKTEDTPSYELIIS